MTDGSKDTNKPTQEDRRKGRLAQALRANLQKRKTQSRSRRTGEADARPEGLAVPTEPTER